jgi:hypothetical protein
VNDFRSFTRTRAAVEKQGCNLITKFFLVEGIVFFLFFVIRLRSQHEDSGFRIRRAQCKGRYCMIFEVLTAVDILVCLSGL